MSDNETLRITILPNGDMQLQANNPMRRRIAAEMKAGRRDRILWDLFEGEWDNGGYTPFEPGDGEPGHAPFVGLTSAPCIAESMDVHDDGTHEIVGRLWWFPDYMVRDELEELRDRGRVVFTLADDEAAQPESIYG